MRGSESGTRTGALHAAPVASTHPLERVHLRLLSLVRHAQATWRALPRRCSALGLTDADAPPEVCVRDVLLAEGALGILPRVRRSEKTTGALAPCDRLQSHRALWTR